jgi:hypothetical protein
MVSVCGREVYAIGRAVQKHGFEELAPFAVIAGKVQRISTMRERNGLKIHLSGNPNFETSSCSGERCHPTLTLDECPQHGFQRHLSLSRADIFALKLNPSFIEAIEHPNARLWVLHAL